MVNANKAKGDRAEAAVRDAVVMNFPGSWRTRAGWDDDRGDVILDLLGDRSRTYAIQVKDVASPAWGEWIQGLRGQILKGGHRGGVIWWKLRGKADPRDWRVVMTGSQYLDLMDRLRHVEAALDGINSDGQVI